MGKAADKVNGNGAHRRVVNLRNQIIRQRDMLSEELEELRRRRQNTLVRGKQTMKLAAGAAVGIFVISSMANAVSDLFRKDIAEYCELNENSLANGSVGKLEQKHRGLAALTGAVFTMLVNEMRKSAVSYAKRELLDQIARYRSKTVPEDHSHNGHIGDGQNSELA